MCAHCGQPIEKAVESAGSSWRHSAHLYRRCQPLILGTWAEPAGVDGEIVATP